MAEKTKIQWAHATFSPWRGCRKISPGCANCYIYGAMPLLFAKQKSGSPRIRARAALWHGPVKWNRAAEKAKETTEGTKGTKGTEVLPPERTRVFPSLCDWLDDEMPIEWLADFLELVWKTLNLDWLLLTKRPEKFVRQLAKVRQWAGKGPEFYDFIDRWLNGNPPENVWIGASGENQEWYDKRRRELESIPAKVRFWSLEPLLGPIDLRLRNGTNGADGTNGIDWVIVGGESGPGARPCDVAWVRDVVRQCKAAGVPVFVKQLGFNIYGDYYERDDFFSDRMQDGRRRLIGWRSEKDGQPPIGTKVAFRLKDDKGGDMEEWAEDLRIRQFPGEIHGSTESRPTVIEAARSESPPYQNYKRVNTYGRDK